MESTAYVVALKFSPGKFKEFRSIGEQIQARGFNVEYLLAEGYARMTDDDRPRYVSRSESAKTIVRDLFESEVYRQLLDAFRTSPPEIVYLHSTHPLNPLVAKLATTYGDPTVLYTVHEPYTADKLAYGLGATIVLRLVEHSQQLTLRNTDVALVPSRRARNLFKRRYSGFCGELRQVELAIPDQYIPPDGERVWFSIIGNINDATGHEEFCDLARQAPPDYQFCLLTGGEVPSFVPRSLDCLELVNDEFITDRRINETIARSHAVFKLDREGTQSGVIPVSYMNYTPVIARNIRALRQHVQHGETGYLLPESFTVDDAVKAMRETVENVTTLGRNARTYYERYWEPDNWGDSFDQILAETHR